MTRQQNIERVEEIIKNTDLTAYQLEHPYENKGIVRLSGSYAPLKLATAIVDALTIDQEKVEDVLIENADRKARIWFSDTARAISQADIIRVKG